LKQVLNLCGAEAKGYALYTEFVRDIRLRLDVWISAADAMELCHFLDPKDTKRVTHSAFAKIGQKEFTA
jgi:hypothetical protein